MPDASPEESSTVDQIKAMILGLMAPDKVRASIHIDEDGWVDMNSSRFFIQKKALGEDNDYQRLVTGVVLEPGVADLHGEIAKNEEEVRKAAHSFMEFCQKTNTQHEKDSDAKVVESWVTLEDQVINEVDIKKGTWLMTMKLPEDEFEKVLKGEFTGFSVGCKGVREAVTKAKREYKGEPINFLKDLSFEEKGCHVALVDEAANGHDLLIIKSAKGEVKAPKGKLDLLKDAAASLEESLDTDIASEALTTLEEISQIIARIIEEGKSVTKKVDEVKEEDIQKAVETAVAKAVEKLESEKQDLLKTVEALTTSEHQRQLAEFTKSVEGLGVEADKVEDLFKFATANPESWTAMKDVVQKALDSKANSPELDETGTSDTGDVHKAKVVKGVKGVPASVMAKAKEIMAAEPTLTQPQAIAKALKGV